MASAQQPPDPLSRSWDALCTYLLVVPHCKPEAAHFILSRPFQQQGPGSHLRPPPHLWPRALEPRTSSQALNTADQVDRLVVCFFFLPVTLCSISSKLCKRPQFCSRSPLQRKQNLVSWFTRSVYYLTGSYSETPGTRNNSLSLI